MTLHQRLDDAVTFDVTPALSRAIARALDDYRAPESVTPAQSEARRRALLATDAAAAALLRALAALDRAWGQKAPRRRTCFINDEHAALRAEAVACRRAWRTWLDLPHTPKPPVTGRQADARRHHLGLAVVWALHDAGLPLDQIGPIEDTLRVVLAEADVIDGVARRPRRDLYRPASRWVGMVRAIDEELRSGRARIGRRVIEVPPTR